MIKFVIFVSVVVEIIVCPLSAVVKLYRSGIDFKDVAYVII